MEGAMTTVARIEEHSAPSHEARKTIAAIVADLSKPVAPRHIRTRKQGGSTLSYIEWHVACNYLDHYAPGWSWQIVSILEQCNMTVVHGSLTIPASDGVVSRHATGIEDTDSKGYGDPVSNASAMAFKRAAALFGLGRHLYNKAVVE
jgi:DNA repair RAD52-like protein 1, mitochondrial